MSYVTVPGKRLDIRMWTDPNTVEWEAREQLRKIALVPYVDGVAVMPDCHLGKGATVGSVIASRTAVLPSAVGVDIGCGMAAVRTNLRAEDLPDDLGPLRNRIEELIPVGFAGHGEAVRFDRLTGANGWDCFWDAFNDLHPGVQNLQGRARAQMGSLGGGNHFLEVTLSDVGDVWLMLHSGSRNIGKSVAERHIAIAKTLEHNQGLPDPDLGALLVGTPEYRAYRRDLLWCQEYAARNRSVMLALFQQTVRDALPTCQFDTPISCHHNYLAEEVYDGTPMLITRKGAIRAGVGELGIIPGSMGTGSYVVRGLGNEAAYNSASHGAGRRMSRGAAKRTFTLEDLAHQTAGVECRKDVGVLDEIPGAYKDIEQVMALQADLVEVVEHLRQVLCVKG